MKFLALILVWSAFAAQLPTTRMTIQIKDAGAREVLEGLFEEGNVQYVIDGKVTNSIKINLEVRNRPWNEVFRDVLTQAHLAYSIDSKGKIRVSPGL